MNLETLPWYRQRWPWILMSGPAIVLVAGIITTWIAFASADGLVAEDYYRKGLGINKVLARDEAARQRGIDAEVRLKPNRMAVRLSGEEPAVIFVHLVHSTRAGHDQRLRLERAADGSYEADLGPLPPGRWRIAIEDPRGEWRILKEAS
jgi:uncharacterized protein